MIHETCHVVQRYRGRGNPGWLVEGVADYVRFFVYEPGKAGPVNHLYRTLTGSSDVRPGRPSRFASACFNSRAINPPAAGA